MIGLKFATLFLLLIHFLNGEDLSSQKKIDNEKEFFVLTIPKSGTHLIMKMILMLTGKMYTPGWALVPQLNVFDFGQINGKEMEDVFLKAKNLNRYLIAHTNFVEGCELVSNKYSEYVKILLIRDLRDICISCVFHQEEAIQKEIGSSNFNEQLMFIITLGDKETKEKIFHLKKYAQLAARWRKDPQMITCRFEHLIGEKGGGSLNAQLNEIQTIAKSLNLFIEIDKLKEISRNLFGMNKGPDIHSSFREGKIGWWRAYFNEDHQKAFEKEMGDLQLSLGYTLE